MKTICKSLCDLLGTEYISAVCEAQAFLTGEEQAKFEAIADEKVDFFSGSFQNRLDGLLSKVSAKVCNGLQNSNTGAATASFAGAQHNEMAPLAGLGPIRIGENGKAYLIGKSEHYHASLGHHFPGYRLIENAKKIGICNVTHNNTRGYITRILERELIRVANGLAKDDITGLEKVLASKEEHVLNRVTNLETGSLAVEASLKMMLARFYRLDSTYDTPKYAGKTPVFLVMADNVGGKQANYHGTTILTQMLRGMWPGFAEKLEAAGCFKVVPVKINDIDFFTETVTEYDKEEYKIAGFFHELVLMNYGGIKLTQEFVSAAHALCRKHNIPIMIDEIQSCMWSPELFMFKEYKCKPDFVSVGKGFPGGQYPASKILTTAVMDSLNQFGALVTNGQEELASLSYLITMEFAESNSKETREIGQYYNTQAAKLVAKYSHILEWLAGEAHMTTFVFKTA
ncbi:MAG: aminotransferase class III-fold pyridoxal phosphate-dependent enzyme, partial [Victivallaceae bacterium]|nr:aminotransferase class III-fold pyridoxal phosphate-dependent enzyme [Victivallaceae bacterium]